MSDELMTHHTDECIHEPRYCGTEECSPNIGSWNQPQQWLIDAAREALPAAPWCRLVQYAWEVDRVEVEDYDGPSVNIDAWAEHNDITKPFVHFYRAHAADPRTTEGPLLFIPNGEVKASNWEPYVLNPAGSPIAAIRSAKIYLRKRQSD